MSLFLNTQLTGDKAAKPLLSPEILATKVKKRLRKFMPDWFLLIRRYQIHHGSLPNVIRPKSFNEKVLYRVLFDRRPVLQQMADKIASRVYIQERIGSHVLPKLYFLTTKPETIPFDILPDKFVVKPTHGSSWIKIVTDKSQLDREELINLCNEWLQKSFYDFTREWAYRDIVPHIMVEEYIDDGHRPAPINYKFFTFHGEVKYVRVITGYGADELKFSFTRDWQPLNVNYWNDHAGEHIEKPPHYNEMVQISEMLCKDLDFIRVDFYDTPEKPYCGELTATPNCGMVRFAPATFDYELGSYWKLPARRTLR